MTDTQTPPLVDTSDMVRFHRIFREALSAAPKLVSSVQAGDTARAALVGDYYTNVLRLLHAHHTGEDELLTPKLLDRCPDQAEVIARVADQHHNVDGALGNAAAALAAWRTEPELRTATALTDALQSLGTALVRHLDDEEAYVLPIAARAITEAEWNQLPANGLRHFDGDKLWLVLGLIRQQMTAHELEQMDASMPPPLAEAWSHGGRDMFEDFVSALQG